MLLQNCFFISSSIAFKIHFCLLNYTLFKEAIEKMFYYSLKKSYVEKAGKLRCVAIVVL